MIRSIDRYIARLTLKPFLAVLGVTMALLLLDHMLPLFRLTLADGQPPPTVALMLLCLLPEYFVTALPIALLFGTALTFRKLALSSELDAAASAGLSFLQLLRLPIVMACGVSLVLLVLSGTLEPQAEYRLQTLLYEIGTGQFGLSLKPGRFYRLGRDATLRIERLEDGGTTFGSVFLKLDRKDGTALTLTARHARLALAKGVETLILHLDEGMAVVTGEGIRAPSVLKFEHYDLPLRLPRHPPFRARGRTGDELTLDELWAAADGAGAAGAGAAAQFHARLMRCLIVPGLPFLAVGMGMPLRRKATMRGLAAGFAIYILFLKGIDFLAAAGMVSAGPAIWSLGAFFLGLAGLLYRATIRGHPLAVPALALSLPSFFAVRPKFFASKVKDLEKAAL